jgi:hypothetical protein
MAHLLSSLADHVPAAKGDIAAITTFLNTEGPNNQQGVPEHLDAVATKVEELGQKYPDQKAFFDAYSAAMSDYAETVRHPPEGGRRRRTRKHKRRARKTRRV